MHRNIWGFYIEQRAATKEERRCQRTVQILLVNPGKNSVTNTQNLQTLEKVPENDISEAATI